MDSMRQKWMHVGDIGVQTIYLPDMIRQNLWCNYERKSGTHRVSAYFKLRGENSLENFACIEEVQWVMIDDDDWQLGMKNANVK